MNIREGARYRPSEEDARPYRPEEDVPPHLEEKESDPHPKKGRDSFLLHHNRE